MKVKLAISSEILEDLVTIEAQAMSEQITNLVTYIQNLDKQRSSLTVKKGEQVYLVEHDEIVRLYLEDRVLQVETVETTYTSNLRLYQVKEDLPANFLQISQSEIIHIKQLDHLKLTANGLVKLVMKNGSVTYSSRRYLKSYQRKVRTMKKYILSASLGIAIGTIISIITSAVFGQGTYLPLNPFSTMGAYYLSNFSQVTVMLICVAIWATIGILFPAGRQDF